MHQDFPRNRVTASQAVAAPRTAFARSGALLLIGMLVVSVARASMPATPIAIEISGREPDLVVKFNGKVAGFNELLPLLTEQANNFGKFMPCDVLVSDSVPLGAIIRVGGAIKESGLTGEIHFYLVPPRLYQRTPPGTIIRNRGDLFEVTISPFPSPSDIAVPITAPSVLSIRKQE